MNPSRKWLWTAIFASVALLASSVYSAYYHFSHKEKWPDTYLSAQKYDKYIQGIRSQNEILELKECYILEVENRKKKEGIMQEYMDTMFWASVILVVLASACLISWFFYVRAVQKE